MDKAEKLFNKLAMHYRMQPGQVENNYHAYTSEKAYKHQAAESGKMVENNKMVVDSRTEDKHERKPTADEKGSKKQAALQSLRSKWING